MTISLNQHSVPSIKAVICSSYLLINQIQLLQLSQLALASDFETTETVLHSNLVPISRPLVHVFTFCFIFFFSSLTFSLTCPATNLQIEPISKSIRVAFAHFDAPNKIKVKKTRHSNE